MVWLTIVAYGLVGVTWYSMYRASLNLDSPWLYHRARDVSGIVGFIVGMSLWWPIAVEYGNMSMAPRAGYFFGVNAWLTAWAWPLMARDLLDFDPPT